MPDTEKRRYPSTEEYQEAWRLGLIYCPGPHCGGFHQPPSHDAAKGRS